MSDVGVSVIIPTRNVSAYISNIIKILNTQNKGIGVEYIIIDMDSDDLTVANSLKAIKENRINGVVLQNGRSTIGCALNTGIYKASGKYITFVFPKSLYSDFIPGYYETAEKYGADFVFASSGQSRADAQTEAVILDNISGAEFAAALIKSLVSINFSAVMLRRDFILSNHIVFSKIYRRGYAEQYVYKAALANPKISFCRKQLVRDTVNQAASTDKIMSDEIYSVFEKIDAMKEIMELLRNNYSDNTKLCNMFEFEKLPDTVLNCVDSLLKSGVKPYSVKKALKIKHFDELIVSSKETPSALKRSIFVWNKFPGMYKPRD